MATPYEKYMQLMQQKSVNTSMSSDAPFSGYSALKANDSFQSSYHKPSLSSSKQVEAPPHQPRMIPPMGQSNVRTGKATKDLFKQRVQSPQKKFSEASLNKDLKKNFKTQEFGGFNQLQSNHGNSAQRQSDEYSGDGGKKELDMSMLFKKNGQKASTIGGGGNYWANRNRPGKFRGQSSGRKSGSSSGGEKLIYIELAGPNTYALKMEGFYDEDLKNKIKSMPNSKYDVQSREWLVRKDLYDKMIEMIAEICLDKKIKIVDIPNFAHEMAKNSIPFSVGKCNNAQLKLLYEQENKRNKEVKFEDLPAKMRDNLYDFQKKGIEFGVSRFGRLLLGDEMGVGKTLQAIAIAYIYKSDWPLLIVAPSSLRFTWKDELLKWLPSLKEKDIQLFKSGKDEWSPDACIFIMSYDIGMRRGDEVSMKSFKACIADEAHYLKSKDAKRSKVLLPILQAARRCIMISGTPMLSRPVEVYNLLSTIRPDTTPSFTNFTSRYCNPKETGWGMDYSGNSCTKELHYVLAQSIMIRRLKKDVLSELPPKRRQKIEVATDKVKHNQVRKLMNRVMQEMVNGKGGLDPQQALLSDFTNFSEHVNQQQEEQEEEKGSDNAFMTAYRLTGEAKIEGITDFMETLIDNGCKFLIFAHHLSVMDGIEQYTKKKVGAGAYMRIDGKVGVDARHERVQSFQQDDNVRIAILSITACSQGLTLTAASNIVFAELLWTPSIMTQAEDRACRIGQQNSVNIYYLHGAETVDEILFQLLTDKSQVVSDALDGKLSEYHIQKAGFDQAIEEVKDLKEKGTLNPIIIKNKKIEDFFKKQKDLQDFVKKPKSSRSKKKYNEEAESIEDIGVSEEEDEHVPLNQRSKDRTESVDNELLESLIEELAQDHVPQVLDDDECFSLKSFITGKSIVSDDSEEEQKLPEPPSIEVIDPQNMPNQESPEKISEIKSTNAAKKAPTRANKRRNYEEISESLSQEIEEPKKKVKKRRVDK